MKAVILAGGRGSRLYPIGMTQVKALVKILNKPILLWNLESLISNGIREFVVVISADEFGQGVKTYLENLNLADTTFEFAIQEKQLGTANALYAAKEYLEKETEFLYFNGDDLYGPASIRQAISEPGLCALAKEVNDPRKFGVFETDQNSNLIRIIEKPKTRENKLANMGGLKLSGKIFELIPNVPLSSRKEYEITDAITELAKIQPVKVVAANDYYLPVGYPWDILDVNNTLMEKVESKIEGELEANVVVKGKLVLPKSSKILAGTYIDGDLIVGENTMIGPYVNIRGTVVIGDNCKISFGTEIKNSALGNDNRISNSYIGDSVFGNNINFPYALTENYHKSVMPGHLENPEDAEKREDKGVITLVKNQLVETEREKLGAIIGDNVNIGARTIIYPGVKIWSNANTAPGEIVRRDVVNQWQ